MNLYDIRCFAHHALTTNKRKRDTIVLVLLKSMGRITAQNSTYSGCKCGAMDNMVKIPLRTEVCTSYVATRGNDEPEMGYGFVIFRVQLPSPTDLPRGVCQYLVVGGGTNNQFLLHGS